MEANEENTSSNDENGDNTKIEQQEPEIEAEGVCQGTVKGAEVCLDAVETEGVCMDATEPEGVCMDTHEPEVCEDTVATKGVCQDISEPKVSEDLVEDSNDSDDLTGSDLNDLSSLSDVDTSDDDEFQLKPMKHSSANSIDSYNLFDVTNVNLNNSKNISAIEPVEITGGLDGSSDTSPQLGNAEKKKLSIGDTLVNCEMNMCENIATEKEVTPEPPQKTSVFRSIGRFFWKSSTKDVPVTQNQERPNSIKMNPGSKITFLDGEQQQNWDFDVVTRAAPSNKKVLKPEDSPFNIEKDDYDENSGPESDEAEGDVDETSIPAPFCLELRDKNRLQCNEWRKQFKRCKHVSINCIPVLEGELEYDAVIIPGNSFGFLDGEPEIRYSRKFGWNLQEDLQKIIFNEYDGELLVGQAVIVPLNDNGENEEASNLSMVKYAVYTPVMRVPLHVEETVNAYLALRAAIKAIKLHNTEHSEDNMISSVLCPALCDGFGSMPPGRIAIQMKAAYEAFVLKKSEDLIEPKGLGAMATSHVNMTRNNGSWC